MTVWLFSIGKDMVSQFRVSLHSQNNQGTMGNGTTQPVIKLPRGKKHGTWNPATTDEIVTDVVQAIRLQILLEKTC